MSTPADHDVTRLLARIREGDGAATGELLNAAYADLRALAATLFGSENPGHTLQPTALVNEVCLRILKTPTPNWNDRKHFFCVAAKAMRNILTDYARAKNADRRGGGAARVPLDSLAHEASDPSPPVDLLALDSAIEGLAKFDPRYAQIFELRFLVGLTVEQTATVTDMSPRAIERDTRFIRAWLQRDLAA